jgi:hypothetical protein
MKNSAISRHFSFPRSSLAAIDDDDDYGDLSGIFMAFSY